MESFFKLLFRHAEFCSQKCRNKPGNSDLTVFVVILFFKVLYAISHVFVNNLSYFSNSIASGGHVVPGFEK